MKRTQSLFFVFLTSFFLLNSLCFASETKDAHTYFSQASFLYIQSKLEPALLEVQDGLKHFPEDQKLQNLEDRIQELMNSRKPPKKKQQNKKDDKNDSQSSSSNQDQNKNSQQSENSSSSTQSSNSQNNSSTNQNGSSGGQISSSSTANSSSSQSTGQNNPQENEQQNKPPQDLNEAEADALLKDFEKEDRPKGKRKKINGRLIEKDW